MIHTIVFEGFVDYEAGWEFDMPVMMVKPVIMAGDGGNSGHIDDIVEIYCIDLSMGRVWKDEKPSKSGFIWPYRTATFHSHFRKAKAGKARRGIEYWSRTVQLRFDGDDFEMAVISATGAGAKDVELGQLNESGQSQRI